MSSTPAWLAAIETWLATDSAPAGNHLLLLLGLNSLLSLLLALPARRLLEASLRARPWRDYLTLAGFGTLIPVLGPSLLLLLLLTVRRLRLKPLRHQPQHLEGPAFAPEIAAVPAHFGVGGAVARLRRAGGDSHQGTRALMAIDQRHNAFSTGLLRETLGHGDENLRLLAHSLIDHRESRIAHLIRRLELAQAKAPAPLASKLHLELASLHQEMLYLHLAREGMVRLHRNACRRHLEACAGPLGESPRWQQLMARLAAQEGDNAHSEACYRRALAAGGAPARILPYLAEPAWQRRDLEQVRQLFASRPIFRELPLSGHIAERWRRPHGEVA